MQRKYCSVNEAVAITGLGRTSIALLIKTGKIKSAKGFVVACAILKA